MTLHRNLDICGHDDLFCALHLILRRNLDICGRDALFFALHLILRGELDISGFIFIFLVIMRGDASHLNYICFGSAKTYEIDKCEKTTLIRGLFNEYKVIKSRVFYFRL